MQMTDAEICRSYKRAIESGTAKTKQIAILSQLNACDKSVIRKILTENGFEVPQNGNRYTAKKSDTRKTDCSECAIGETCGSGKPDGVHCNAFLAKSSEGSKVSAPEDGLLKSEEQTRLIKSEESEVTEANGSERKQDVGTCQQNVGKMSEKPDSSNLSARVPDFVISIAVQKLEDMTKELNELMEYADTLKAQINELRHWISVATEGEENGTEESD